MLIKERKWNHIKWSTKITEGRKEWKTKIGIKKKGNIRNSNKYGKY